MDSTRLKRRSFVKGSLSALALTSLPARFAFGQTTGTRLEWTDFRASPDYPTFVNAIRTMRANTNPNDRRSWLYWTNIHVNSCLHDVPYFLAWHRGYLHYFQETLRMVSGNNNLMVPYWDYYRNPIMPVEFTDPACENPLYVTGRVNTNVFSSLALQPFSPTYTDFQRGTRNSFEVQIEWRPHGLFHNVVGGVMARLDAAMDPIFWLHHSQIDRLWTAWVAAGAGRTMPASTSPYWAGAFTYTPELSIARNQLISTTTLGYRYQNETMPTALPAQGQLRRSEPAKIIRVQMPGAPGRGGFRRPPLGKFGVSAPKAIAANRRSIGGATQIALDENSVSAQIPIQASDSQALQTLIEGAQASPFGRQPSTGTYTEVQVTLNNARVTAAGVNGGYFYEIYLNLPESGTGAQESYFLGGIGPFQIATSQHHSGSSRRVFSATKVLQDLNPTQLRDITVSFVRRGGTNSPRGQVIGIGEVRIELSTDPAE